METKYDKTIDAKYVSIRKGKISHTKKEQDWLLFDCDKNGDVLGIEILDASKHLISVHTVKEKFLGCSVMESKPLGKDRESLGLTVDSPEYAKDSQFALV